MSKFQSLSTSEKILLAEELWDSALEDEGSVSITDEQKTILEERLRAYQLDGEAGSPWDVVKKRIMENE